MAGDSAVAYMFLSASAKVDDAADFSADETEQSNGYFGLVAPVRVQGLVHFHEVDEALRQRCREEVQRE